MPDVVIVGGGIIGAACALELAGRGASVTLLEREELAAGASGRNQGWFVLSSDPACAPMSRVSLERYVGLIEDSPVPVRFDREPIGHLLVTRDADAADALRERAQASAATGVRAEALDAAALRAEEPALAEGFAAAWLIDQGHRIEPAALTVAHALRAREMGAEILRHTMARALTTVSDRVTGVVTDEGVIAADTVIVAAGPWSSPMVRPLGVDLPVTGSRGWIVELDAPQGLVRHLIEEEGLPAPVQAIADGNAFPTAAAFIAAAHPPPSVAALLHAAPDGTVVCGASHHPALRTEPDDMEAPRRIVERAVGVVPALADTTVRGIRWGIRPMTPDGRPIVGWLREGLFAAAGHGPEGILLGGGTGALVAALVSGDEPPFDPAPFEPSRFWGPPRL
ncbi:MAG: NAD(P)/FAD-dependent oxidoreductase [Solirubrobacteraceae bacterium]